MDFVWHWEQTPLEAWAGFVLWDGRHKNVPKRLVDTFDRVEASGFRCERYELGGGLTCQLAVSDRSSSRDVQATRAEHPELPVSGDRRSGVIIFDGERIAANFISDGNLYDHAYRTVVAPEYRGRGLAQRAVLEWYKRVRRPRVVSKQRLNVAGAKVFLAVQSSVYAWALQHGKAVPDKVLRELETRAETLQLKEAMARVQSTGEPFVIGLGG